MAEPAPQQAIGEEILADARRKADRIAAKAAADAEKRVETARTHAREIAESALADARKRADREAATLIADVPHQEQVRALQIKEEKIRALFQQTLHSLREREYDVPAVLTTLGADAISVLDGDEFVVEIAEQDERRLAGRLADRVAAEVTRRHGRKVSAAVLVSPELNDGGVIVRTRDGRRMVDNSFATRIERAEQELRNQVERMLYGEEKA